jgi:hypothetical protein
MNHRTLTMTNLLNLTHTTYREVSPYPDPCPFCDIRDHAVERRRRLATCPWHPRFPPLRYPIPERIFDYVPTVRSATAGTAKSALLGSARASVEILI